MKADPIIQELWDIKDRLSRETGEGFINLDSLLEGVRGLDGLGATVDLETMRNAKVNYNSLPEEPLMVREDEE